MSDMPFITRFIRQILDNDCMFCLSNSVAGEEKGNGENQSAGSYRDDRLLNREWLVRSAEYRSAVGLGNISSERIQDASGVSNAENCMVRELWNRERFGESGKVLHCSSV